MSTYNQIKNSNIAETTVQSEQFIQLRERNGEYVHKPLGYHSYNDKRVISTINPSGGTPTTLNNNYVTFKIDSGLIDVMQFPSIHFTLNNATGSAGSVGASWNFINYIEVGAQNGTTPLCRIEGIDLFHSYLMLDRNTYEAMANVMGMHATTYANLGTSVANGDSITMNLPLFHFFKSTGIATSLLNQNLSLKVFFNPTAKSHISATAFTVSSLELLLRGKDLKEKSTKLELEAIYRHPSIPLSLGHLQIDRQMDELALVASKSYTITLKSCTGICSFIIFTVRLASDTATTANMTNYVRMLDYDILNSGNTSLIGAYKRDVGTQTVDYAINWSNNAFLNKGFGIMCWSNDPRGSYTNGYVSGYAVITSNEKLTFTTPSTLASGDYVIDTYAYSHANLIVNNGNLIVDQD